MRRSTAIALTILISTAFNIWVAIVIDSNATSYGWPFSELGPAILQDSYYSRAPGLETVYGTIGDVPGGYSLYSGSPLQDSDLNTTAALPHFAQPWPIFIQTIEGPMLMLAVLFAVVPLISIIIIGRRSYGSTKTR